LNRYYSEKLKKTLIMLTAGEYFATQKGEVLYTVVGSCIATCIYDAERKIGGMNHFLLPGMIHPDEMLSSDVGRYGMFAMELLIGELIKLGARRSELKAKLFGGGKVLTFRKDDGDVTASNIRFARKFLELEGIPTVNEDVGGKKGRKIMFHSDTSRVFVKRFAVGREKEAMKEEQAYKARVFQKRFEKSPVMMFKS
jgi:chemotaxis protein CheD